MLLIIRLPITSIKFFNQYTTIKTNDTTHLEGDGKHNRETSLKLNGLRI